MLRSTAFLMSIAISAPVLGEQLFVEDKLVLNVYAQADQTGGRIATIQTGDSVEALERLDNLVHVRLEDGREGWVSASYLSADPPAVIKLKELQSTQGTTPGEPPKQLTDEIARLKKHNSALQSEIGALQKKLAAAPAAVAAVAAAPAVHEEMEVPVEPRQIVQSMPKQRSFAWVWLLALVVAAGGGFVAGYQTLGHRVRQRFGGVKVY